MSEFFYCLKCLLFTVVIVIAMQLKIGSRSIESLSYEWMRYSKVSVYIQSVAAGGALAIKNLTTKVKDGVAGSADSFREGAEAQAHR